MSADDDQEYVDFVSASLGRLRRSAYLLCGDAHRGDDIVQATLVAVYLRWSKVRTVDNVDGYVHRILVRRYLDEARRPWARVLLSRRMPESPAPAGLDIEDADAVRSALDTLSRGQRSVLVLRFFCDLSVQDTADALGCSVGSVKSQTSRGLTALRGLLGAQWFDTVPAPARPAPSGNDRLYEIRSV